MDPLVPGRVNGSTRPGTGKGPRSGSPHVDRPDPVWYAVAPMEIRHDWSLAEVRAIHDMPLLELVDRARAVHRESFAASEVQLCSLLSVKTGGCPEDCAYCPQAARYHTGVEAEPLLST